MNNLVIQSYINEKEKLVETVTQVHMNHSDSYTTTRNTEKHPNIEWIKERIKTIDEILLNEKEESNYKIPSEGLSYDEVMCNFKK
jgi:hypothetical protein